MELNKDLKSLNQIEMGKRIQKQREFLKLSREEMADFIGISTKFLADVEYGDKGMSLKNLFLLSQAMNISLDYIVAGEQYSEVEKDRIAGRIIEPMRSCNIGELQCLEQIVKYYLEGIRSSKK